MTGRTTSAAPRVEEVDLGTDVGAWFTGRAERPDPEVGRAGNLSHHRPHVPAALAEDRAAVGRATGTDPAAWHMMLQVHGADVGVVDADTPRGAQLRDVDALVTTQQGRVLAVAAADCVPVLLATDRAVGAVHAGRLGVQAGAVEAAVAALPGDDLRAAVGPAIGGCCYEVPADMQREVLRTAPAAEATTTWGTPSLDLPVAVVATLEALGAQVQHLDQCTRCDDGWFSHRADPGAGRQFGLVVRR